MGSFFYLYQCFVMVKFNNNFLQYSKHLKIATKKCFCPFRFFLSNVCTGTVLALIFGQPFWFNCLKGHVVCIRQWELSKASCAHKITDLQVKNRVRQDQLAVCWLLNIVLLVEHPVLVHSCVLSLIVTTTAFLQLTLHHSAWLATRSLAHFYLLLHIERISASLMRFILVSYFIKMCSYWCFTQDLAFRNVTF